MSQTGEELVQELMRRYDECHPEDVLNFSEMNKLVGILSGKSEEELDEDFAEEDALSPAEINALLQALDGDRREVPVKESVLAKTAEARLAGPQLTLYHGAERLKPEPGFGERDDAFGIGFYCTESEETAGAWAVSSLRSGFINRYTLDRAGLQVCYLNGPGLNILNWLATVAEQRAFPCRTAEVQQAREYLRKNFSLPLYDFDVVIGYRAADAYFACIEAFLQNRLSLPQLVQIINLCNPGEQIVLKSDRALAKLHFAGFSVAPKSRFYAARKAQADRVNRLLQKLLQEKSSGLYMQDIMRGGMKHGDARLSGNVSA